MKMMDSRSLWTLALLIACCGGASKYYSGENKPYEFGFKLDGEQHRHETKDANGIIMGEFGFITADGVYHVTVYATDENGNFKIISMKNIRVQPYPGSKADAPERRPNPLSAPENSLPAPENSILPQGPSSPGLSAPSPLPIASPVKSCSHCSLPTTTTLRPANVQNNLGPDYSLPQQNPFNSAGPHVLPLNAPEPVNVPSNYELFPPYSNDQTPSVNLQTPNTGFGPANNQNYPSNNALVPGNNALVPGNNALVPGNNALVPGNNALEPGNNALVPGNNALVPGNNALVPGNNPLEPGNNQYNNANNVDNLIKQHEEVINNYNSQHAANKPTLITADLQRVQGQTNIHASAPGERDGLINGLNNGDMLELLYTFNYTLGFHGHHERGYRNGEKKGYYYVTGRDGVRLRVDYVADSTGYHPRISQEVFGLDAPEVPKPETEQNAEFGLKGYEFKWLYFPPGEQSRR